MTDTPYIVPYRIKGETIQVLQLAYRTPLAGDALSPGVLASG